MRRSRRAAAERPLQGGCPHLPMSASTASKQGSLAGAAAGTGSPQRAAKAARPSAFREAVLPPVLGPVAVVRWMVEGRSVRNAWIEGVLLQPGAHLRSTCAAPEPAPAGQPRPTCDDYCSCLRPHCHVNRLRFRRQRLPCSSCFRCAAFRSPAGSIGRSASGLPLCLLPRKQVVAQQQRVPAVDEQFCG